MVNYRVQVHFRYSDEKRERDNNSSTKVLDVELFLSLINYSLVFFYSYFSRFRTSKYNTGSLQVVSNMLFVHFSIHSFFFSFFFFVGGERVAAAFLKACAYCRTYLCYLFFSLLSGLSYCQTAQKGNFNIRLIL